MRVALAGVLFSQPDLLLLDEPTNYLDLEGTLWLEKYLATYPYTVFMISHDRDLLNKAVTSIVHLERGKLTLYKGGYDTFEETRRMQMELNNKARERTLEQIAHLQKFVDRFKAKATKAKQAQARVKMIAKLKPPAALFDEYAAPFQFHQSQEGPGRADAHLRQCVGGLWRQGRAAATSPTASTPTTASRWSASTATASRPSPSCWRATSSRWAARCARSHGLEIAYFAQHQMDKLKPEQTPLEHVIDLMPYDSEAKRRSRIAQMGLTTSRMDTLVKNLSRRRARAPAARPHHLRRAGHADPRRADQPPRHRQPRCAGRRRSTTIPAPC